MGVRYDLASGNLVSQPNYNPTVEERRASIAPVTPRQAKLALLGAGVYDGVVAAFAAIPDETQRKAAQIEWEAAIEFRRDAPLIAQMGAALGLTEEQIDALFATAATL